MLEESGLVHIHSYLPFLAFRLFLVKVTNTLFIISQNLLGVQNRNLIQKPNHQHTRLPLDPNLQFCVQLRDSLCQVTGQIYKSLHYVIIQQVPISKFSQSWVRVTTYKMQSFNSIQNQLAEQNHNSTQSLKFLLIKPTTDQKGHCCVQLRLIRCPVTGLSFFF